MRCTFLREAQVKFCRASAYKKMILRLPESQGQERCSSPAWRSCSAAKHSLEEHPSDAHCPFLEETLVQYCSGAAGASKYIPYSETELFRCGTDSHQYCETFIALAHPEMRSEKPSDTTPEPAPKEETMADPMLDDVQIPERAAFAPNHMWLNVSQDGWWHVGVDAFLTGMFGAIEKVTYVSTLGIDRPAVTLKVNGVYLPFIFPNHMNIERTNAAVRSRPDKLLSEPYTVGWLFEGRDPSENRKTPLEGEMPLLRGTKAKEWLARDIRRLSEFVHGMSSRRSDSVVPLMADGGVPNPGFMQQLTPDEIFRVFNEFCSPYTTWKGAL